jgi:hypothetical protein
MAGEHEGGLMAGMVYLLPPPDPWEQMEYQQYVDFCAVQTLIDGLMGIYYPGFENAWVDYDDGLLYGDYDDKVLHD